MKALSGWWFLKHLSQIGHLPQLGVKIKNIWNHHLVVNLIVSYDKKAVQSYLGPWLKKQMDFVKLQNPLFPFIFRPLANIYPSNRISLSKLQRHRPRPNMCPMINFVVLFERIFHPTYNKKVGNPYERRTYKPLTESGWWVYPLSLGNNGSWWTRAPNGL